MLSHRRWAHSGRLRHRWTAGTLSGPGHRTLDRIDHHRQYVERTIHSADAKTPVGQGDDRGDLVRLPWVVVFEHEVGHAPTLERPIFRGGEQVPPVGRKPDGDDRALVCKTGMEWRIDRRGIDRHKLPEMDPFVAAPADHVLPVGRERDGEHLPLRLIERVEPHAVAGPPKLDRLVGARRPEQFSTRVPGEVEDRPVVDVDRTKQ